MALELYCQASTLEAAKGFSAWCEILVVEQPPVLQSGYALWLDEQGLALLNAQVPQMFRLTADLFTARLGGRSLLARACLSGGQNLTILDPFAGFGMDGFLLAHMGHRLTLVEKNPAIWLMLTQFATTLDLQVETHCADALEFMHGATETWDVVYLDPMFPDRRKKALPNLGLQHLRSMVTSEPLDLESLLETAKQCANLRVVFKQRLKGPVVGKPSHQLKGQTVRFDVYV